MAKKAGEKKLSLKEISQEIDLKKYLGRKPTAEEKRIFADLAKEVVEGRTLEGKDINGKKFKQYSEDYAKLKGVDVNNVDLFLVGEMLGSIGRRTSKERTNTLFLQMKKGLQTKKAYNHMTRKSKANPLPKREFFGITDSEAKQIADEVKELKKQRSISLAELQLAASAIILSGDDDEENQTETEELG
jgi:hypothetical protein